MDAFEFFCGIMKERSNGATAGITSVCCANSYVVRAAALWAARNDITLLVESTANQVDQFGGYTGMKPADFARFARDIARGAGLPENKLILGGDHLGPLVWADKPEAEAMGLAGELIRAYVLAGYDKIHLDTSMRLASDDPSEALRDDLIAERGARLCEIAEAAHSEAARAGLRAHPPVYVIGSEVPTPGGALREEGSEGAEAGACAEAPSESLAAVFAAAPTAASATAHEEAPSASHAAASAASPGAPHAAAPEKPAVTSPGAFRASLEAFRRAFAERGLDSAWRRVVAFVVQPGVEFTGDDVFRYDSAAAASLCDTLKSAPGIVFEGHSTDYQLQEDLRAMVHDGIAILKVGPALTFTLREALANLEGIERALLADDSGKPVALSGFSSVLDAAMLQNPSYWKKHYGEDPAQNRYERRFSYFDRARYYMQNETVETAVKTLLENLGSNDIPAPVLSQFLPSQYKKTTRGLLRPRAFDLLYDAVCDRLDEYLYAVRG